MRKMRTAREEQDEGAMLHRLRMAPPAPRPPRPATVGNIAELMTDIRGCTTALRFYARSCPPLLRPRLTVLADCIDEAMKGVGL